MALQRLHRITLALLLAVPLAPAALAQVVDEPASEQESRLQSTADHTQFEVLEGPFEDAIEVTEACLTCHTEAAKQVHRSIHWTWRYEQPETGQTLGKRNIVNSLCFGIAGNYPRCSSCHVGYGWEDADFDFSAENRVDCLVCHDTTGTYQKFPTAAGHPPYEDRRFQGKLFEAPDLAEVAQHVGRTSRETCGSCHFEGGGGDAVKHGDLDSSLIDPPRELDVHMSPQGKDFTCSTCHEFSGHIQAGSRYHIETDAAGHNPHERPACRSCHGEAPHEGGVHDKLNEHSEAIACQTCHIPEIARGGLKTKTRWDWSTAGRLDEQGEPVVREEDGRVVYHGMKGSFEWAEDYAPSYRWFNGNMRYTLLEDRIDPEGVVPINRPEGGPDEPGAKIWPFKIMEGRQPYDRVRQTLLVPKLFGPGDAAYWGNYDWDKALAAGMEAAQRLGQTDADYSGEHGFVESRMYWPVTHMVAPAEGALGCGACHSDGGRMAGLPGVYVPGEDRHPWVEAVGWAAVGLSLAGVAVHGGIRLVLRRRRRTQEESPS